MIEIDQIRASAWFARLRDSDQVITLHPDYVAADACRDPKLKPVFLLYLRGNKFLLLSAHLTIVPNSEYWALSSAYGYGGPLANTDDEDFLAEAWKAYLGWCQERLVLAELLKLHPLARHHYNGTSDFNRLVYLCGREYEQKCRNTVNKAARLGLTVTDCGSEALAKNFPVDYREHMRNIKAAPFYLFNDKYFRALSKMENARLLVCEEDQKWRAAAIMLVGAKTVEYHLSITNKRGREIGATNYLIHMARQSMCADMELFLGGGKIPGHEDSLGKFKRSFGGRELPFFIGWHIHRPEVYAEMKQGVESGRVFFWQ